MAKIYRPKPTEEETPRFPFANWCDWLKKNASPLPARRAKPERLDEHAIWVNALQADLAGGDSQN